MVCLAVVLMCNDKQSNIESEESLVRRLQNGEVDAFDTLFERFRRKLLAYVRGLVGDAQQSEDIVQETFVELAKKIQKIQPKKGVGPWLYRVARNRAIDLLRHRRFEVLPGEEYFGEQRSNLASDTEDAPDEQLIAKEKQSEIRKMLASLPQKERDLLMLRFYGDLSFAEIAKVVRRPLGTVLWQVRKSLGTLREKMHHVTHETSSLAGWEENGDGE